MSVKSKISVRAALIALASCAAGSALAKPALSVPPKFTQIVTFNGSKGAFPIAPLTFDANGALYGSTSQGGIADEGVIFKLTMPAGGHTQWSYELLHDFANFADGSGPTGQLLLDSDGALYGVTSVGGKVGFGTVFRLTPPSGASKSWTKTVLYNFQGGADGANPYAGLIFDAHGALYGAASGGGATGNGTVFKLTPPTTSGGAWAETILHSFTGADGREPYVPLVFDAQGALYGATYFGGASNQGVVFKLSPPAAPSGKWKYAVLYQFTGKMDGANPMGLIFDKSGTLYGTAAFGAISNWGVVFHLTPPSSGLGAWTETVIHSFTSDGYTPYGGVTFGPDGALYGTTFAGGGLCPAAAQGVCGVVYKLLPPAAGATLWPEQILYGFAGNYAPAAHVTFGPGGALFGTTDFGGEGVILGSGGNGTVFELQ